MLEIEKGIEIPTKVHMFMKYPFAGMEVGDSFFVPVKKPEDLASVTSVAKIKTGFKFTCRTIRKCSICKTRINFSMFCETCNKIIQEEETGVRVWRIE